eukprot:14219211-Alexandrium_andersonii.AAC.1
MRAPKRATHEALARSLRLHPWFSPLDDALGHPTGGVGVLGSAHCPVFPCPPLTPEFGDLQNAGRAHRCLIELAGTCVQVLNCLLYTSDAADDM